MWMLLFGISGSQLVQAQVSTNLSISPQTTPSLTPCSGTGTFVVRVSNISAAPITSVVFRDSLPPGINYISGTVSGTGVTFGSTITANNLVTFNISSIPSSGFVDISFGVSVSCAVSTTSTDIKNTYKASWGTNFTNPFVTPTYSLSFPSLSISVDSPSLSVVCGTPKVRKITICNGGFGSVDSVVLTDVENNVSLSIVGFDKGTASGLGTNSAKTVLKAADFMSIGNFDGKLDQNECIVITDTIKGVTTATPVSGTLTANWGCYGNTCPNGTPNNAFSVNTAITASPIPAALTRTSYVQLNSIDSSGQVFNRVTDYREVITNNSGATAVNSNVSYMVMGMKYLISSSVMVSINGGTPFAPIIANITAGPNTHPSGSMGSVLAPSTYTGQLTINCIRVTIGDLNPGDSAVITFSASTVGPITKTSDRYFYNNNGNFYFCNGGGYYRWTDGPSMGTVLDAKLNWSGPSCAPSNTNICAVVPTGGMVFNGITTVAEPQTNAPIYLGRFRSFSYIDSTYFKRGQPSCNVYGDMDTVQLMMGVGVMDLPFYTDKSKFSIKIATNGGVKWDGDLSQVYGVLAGTSTRWAPSQVVDNSAIDSTMTVTFSKSNCPITNFGTYNTYSNTFKLNMQFVNLCNSSPIRELRMTRIFQIDSTSGEPAMEAGYNVAFPYTFASKCPPVCLDGVQILNYSHARTTFGAPDNNNDGIADGSGALNMTVVKAQRITWGDSLKLKYKMIVKSTQAAGVQYLYMNSSITGGPTDAYGIACNDFLNKSAPVVKLTRPGGPTVTATSTSIPTEVDNRYFTNLSLQGAGGIVLPGITSFLDGDTVELTQVLAYTTPHTGINMTDWNFIHTPYTSSVANPTFAQQNLCDSISCAHFETVDMVNTVTNSVSAPQCSDSIVVSVSMYSQTMQASCNNTLFPGEARSVVTPSKYKMVITAASNWALQRIFLTYTKKINGTGACTNVIVNQILPTSVYTFSGDTVIVDLIAAAAAFGQDARVNQMRSVFNLGFSLKYNAPASQQGCGKDHSNDARNFLAFLSYSPVSNVDSSTLTNIASSTVSYDINGASQNTVKTNWPGTNLNLVSFPAASSVSVTQSNVVIPINYRKLAQSGTFTTFNDFIGIPNRPGIVVDSVKDAVTNAKLVSVPGSAIYDVSYLGNNVTRAFNIYTRVTACDNDTLFIYGDRTPCSGLPTSWTAYTCKSNASKIGFAYLVFQGELQMKDSLYTPQIDICAKDTVQFDVLNTQTQDAFGVKVTFSLPGSLNLIAGSTQLRKGNGSFVTISDPVFASGVYTWTMAGSDTLKNLNFAPNNTLSLRCAVSPTCGYTSGDQIVSSINGNVACGPITSLFNTNPSPLTINSAPSLTYISNVKAVPTPITGCNTNSAGYDYKVSMKISGGATGAGDKIKISLPSGYKYVSYSAAATGSNHAPVGNPALVNQPDGTVELTWILPQGVIGGDSIKFTFKYNEVSTAANKCGLVKKTRVNTYIVSELFCATSGTNCSVAISNGSDTVIIQNLKPSITTTTSNVVWGMTQPTFASKSYLSVTGTLTNEGLAAVPNGTGIILEAFMDLDNSGTINAGDYAFTPFVYSGGLAISGTHNYTYVDSVSYSACTTCSNKGLLLRFSNNPSAPVGASQCYCDSVKVSLEMPSSVPLALTISDLEANASGCSKATLNWNTFTESKSNEYFEIQESVDGKNFKTASSVPTIGVDGTFYSQTVDMPSAKSYFRIKLYDNGLVNYSNVATVRSNCWVKNTISAYPNPFTSTISIDGAEKGSIISLEDIVGRAIKIQEANGSKSDLLDLTGLASGNYMIIVMDGQGQTTRIKISKN